jgi:hypothetical protein
VKREGTERYTKLPPEDGRSNFLRKAGDDLKPTTLFQNPENHNAKLHPTWKPKISHRRGVLHHFRQESFRVFHIFTIKQYI